MLKVCHSVSLVAMGSAKASNNKGPFPFQYGTLLLAPLIQGACILDVTSGFDSFFSFLKKSICMIWNNELLL